MKGTGGRWNPEADNIYFIAADLRSLHEGQETSDNILVAVNEIEEKDIARIEEWCLKGKTLFIDSGVFNLANSHAVSHGITMDEALGLAPDDIDGFDDLLSKYYRIVRGIEGICWGYIEVDQGGRENKIKTRARIEAEGLRPIPVYHPFNDGWDYFDELASNYDRICLGNIVQADPETRKRLIATAWERKQKYPGLWIHVLGMTPNQWMNAYPLSSCDSSAWLNMCRWPDSFRSQAALKSCHAMHMNYVYDLKSATDSETGNLKSKRLGGYNSHFITKTWQCVISECRGNGFEPWGVL